MKKSLLVLLMMHWARVFVNGVEGIKHVGVGGGGPSGYNSSFNLVKVGH
jgi:hypothetical protein